MPTPEPDERARTKALALIADAWAVAQAMESTPIEVVNRSRPPELRYRTQEDLAREWVAVAGAVSTFAVQMGLIAPEDDAEQRRRRPPSRPQGLSHASVRECP
jgi:hypothetical protein